MLLAGEGIADITPPLGIELAGFHKPPGQERKITGIRQPTSARALVLQSGKTEIAIAVLDVIGFSRDFASRVQKRVTRQTGIPASHVRVCATHTHSAPSLTFMRQWGAVSKEYNRQVEDRAVAAVVAARKDLAEADFYLGKQSVTGGNHNRTTKTWRTDAEFTKDSTDDERWLDTTLHALFFLRGKPKQSILWYQFSAHPVCYTDTLAGPDWPGLVGTKTQERDGYGPAFLQGHCGDVNPGDGATSLGDPEKVSEAVWSALHHATNHSELVQLDAIEVAQIEFSAPLDLDRLNEELERYRKDPAACTKGEWVDAAFAKDWFESASKWPKQKQHYATSLSAIRLGEVGLLFHPGELYSVYGLTIRRDSQIPNTIVCGYADDLVGYVPDPKAYEQHEYAALVVPKIFDLPPFKPQIGRELAAASLNLLNKFKKPPAHEQ